MAEEEDEASKTEEATQKKIDDSIKKGQVFSSKEVSNFFLILGLLFILSWVAAWMFTRIRTGLQGFITMPTSVEMDPASIAMLLNDVAWKFVSYLAAPFFIMVVMALIASVIQRPFVFSLDPIKPQLSRISPLKGVKRIFSLKSFVEFLKGILKIALIGVIIYSVLSGEFTRLMPLMDKGPEGLLDFLHSAAIRIVIAVAVALFLLALVDYLYQRFDYYKNLRMTKQEVKDEYKQQEGDPHVKQRLRAIRRERAQQRMMAEVPKADVVITNPTHFAVALQYNAEAMEAPKLVAKGADKVAARIRERAEELDIVIVRNPPVARMIYDSVELDEFIKAEHYQAVAEIIGYVYKLRGKSAPGKGPQAVKPKRK